MIRSRSDVSIRARSDPSTGGALAPCRGGPYQCYASFYHYLHHYKILHDFLPIILYAFTGISLEIMVGMGYGISYKMHSIRVWVGIYIYYRRDTSL